MSTSNNKLAFLTIDGHQWMLDAAKLQWLALTPIKGSENITIGYIQGRTPQREHTIEQSTARDINSWVDLSDVCRVVEGEFGSAAGVAWSRRTDMKTAMQNLDTVNLASAAIDVKLEQVLTMALEIGRNQNFITDIAPAIRELFTLMIRDQFIAASRENRERFLAYSRSEPLGAGIEKDRSKRLVAGIVKDGHTLGGLPLEEKLRPGETPFGYVVGYLSAPALACLEDVVSHASDFRDALQVKRMNGREKDREDGEIDAPLTTVPGNEESYWIHQQEVHERMVQQAREALDIHAKVSGK